MPESFVQLNADGTGKKLRTRQRTVGTNTVEEQYVVQAGLPTYVIWTGALAMAAGKYFLALMNAAGSNQVVKVRKLFLINTQLAAVTGVGIAWEVRRLAGFALGTAVTPNPMDTNDGAVANLTAVSGPTVLATDEQAIIVPWYTNNDEIGLTNAFPSSYLQALGNVLPEGLELKELTLRPGQAMGVKQITASTVGSYGVLAVVTVELI